MRNTTFITGILVAAVSVAATSALAFGPGKGKGMHAGGMQGPQMTFEQLDTDGDGQISKAEMENRRATRFNGVDTDGDGKLSQDEMEAEGRKHVADRVAAMIKQFDTDGDGVLSQDEMPKHQRMGRMFEKADKDGSGGISKQEFTEAREHMQARMKGPDGKHDGKRGAKCGDKD